MHARPVEANIEAHRRTFFSCGSKVKSLSDSDFRLATIEDARLYGLLGPSLVRPQGSKLRRTAR